MKLPLKASVQPRDMPINAAALTCPCTIKLTRFLFVSVVAPQMLADISCYPLHVLLFSLFSGCCKIVAFSTGLQDREITKGNHKGYSSFYLFFFFFFASIIRMVCPSSFFALQSTISQSCLEKNVSADMHSYTCTVLQIQKAGLPTSYKAFPTCF